MNSKKIKLLVADDHRLFIEGLKYVMKDELRIDVSGFALNGKEAIEKCSKGDYDVVLMDINMPVIDGINATIEIKRLNKGIKIIMLSMLADLATITKALKAGADGYVLKSNSSEDLMNAFIKVSRDEIFISPSLAYYFNDNPNQPTGTRDSMVKFSEELITPREQQVLKLIAEGFTDQKIAETLFLSDKTVSTHRKNMLAKLNLPNTAALVRFAIENNLA